MVNVTRRGLFRLGAGAAATAVAVLFVPLVPGTALAVAVVDDAVIGAVVAAIAALGGYLVTSGPAFGSYEALGKGFQSYVQSASNKAQAVSLCMQAAAQYGANIQEVEAQAAADAVAGLTGFFGTALEDAAATGRLALDGVVSGVSAGAGVLRNLVSGYMGTLEAQPGQMLLPDATSSDLVSSSSSPWSSFMTSKSTVSVYGLSEIMRGVDLPSGATWAFGALAYSSDGQLIESWSRIIVGNGKVQLSATYGGTTAYVIAEGGTTLWRYNVSGASLVYRDSSTSSYTVGSALHTSIKSVQYEVSSDLVISGTLPGVDRATDAPDVITPGYDSVALGKDLVIDGTTGAVSGAGSIPLPESVPDVIGGLNDWLDGALAGVVPGTIALPVPVDTPVVVATPEGIATMPIDQARAQDTSLGEPGYVPPVSPIDPPVTVPDGPWTPAVTLPFESVWPFNMIYDVVELFRDLGA